MKEFSKMESIVEHTHRKAERTKTLMMPVKLTPIALNKLKAQPLSTTRIPIRSDLKLKVIESKTPSLKKSITQIPKTGKHNNKTTFSMRNSQVSNVKELKCIDSPMTKGRRKSANNIKNINNKLISKPKERIQNVKEMVSTKIHPFSV